MARTTKRGLGPKQIEVLFAQLNRSINTLTEKQTGKFLDELLGPEEKIMIAKRLSAMIMLRQGMSIYATARALKISTATASRLRKKLISGACKELVKGLRKDEPVYIEILETLDAILHLGGILPHYNGLDRYKHLR